ncbi:MAG TPA: lipopolysaccharide kinase InaA family protein, partial [Terriglobales bacterium]|nr:lipopolysaccharide kinase InaA family protein [Terriglobales bacterium]
MSRNFVNGSFAQQLLDCDRLLARHDCQIIKDQKKIKVGRVSFTIGGQVLHVYVKRYNAFSLRYRFGSVMAASGAVKSLIGAAILRKAGIRTARPLAAVETRVNRMLAKSFFVTEEIAGGKTADAYWVEDLASRGDSLARQLRQEFLRGLASVFRSLHAAQIYHNDLKDANILIVPGVHGSSPRFFLLDL